MSKIFVLGSINMDLVFELNRFPALGETVKAQNFFMSPGGKGANQAVACAKQGIQTYLIGRIGSDSLSSICKTSLLEYGVDCSYIVEEAEKTCGVAGIIVEQSDNRIITSAGANENHDDDSQSAIVQSGESGDILITQLEIPYDVVKNAFQIAKKKGMFTILNAAPAEDFSFDVLKYVDILIVNETELYQITTFKASNQKNIMSAFELLFQHGVQSVLLTLGEEGSIYFDQSDLVRVNAYQVEVVDTTAAGDTYIGVLASQLIMNQSIETAMRNATAAAALAIQRWGAQKSIPSMEEWKSFMLEKEGRTNG